MPKNEWNHTPATLPLKVNPLWTRPFNGRAALAWWWGSWFPVKMNLVLVGLAWLSWSALGLSFSRVAEPGFWIVEIFLRNLILVSVFAQGLHWALHTYSVFGRAHKYDKRPYPRKGKSFTFGDQYWDNVFWAIASGVTIWSLFEASLLWAQANGFARLWLWDDGPVWFILLLFLIPVWQSFYFFLIHRALHTKYLWRFHKLHHRNTDVGPWSGLSMHPVEHLLYFGTIFIHLVIPSHPIHVICHLFFFGCYPILTHSGFEGIWMRGEKRFHLGNFHHQLHHKLFEVNYGTLEVPMDLFFGSFHDGTDESEREQRLAMRERIKQNRGL